MKIFLLGKTGLLGNALFQVLSAHHKILAPSHQECDITNSEVLKKWLAKNHLDMVINTTGYTAVDKAEKEKERAFELNAQAVGNLALILKKQNTPLLHFSTDYVFDGKNSFGYRESDIPSPLSVYGASKAAGEEAVKKNLTRYYLIRTSWLFGPGGNNFVDTMLEKINPSTLRPKGRSLLRVDTERRPLGAVERVKKGEIRVINDQKGNPTFTFDLAKAILRLLESNSYGIYHLVNEGSCTWYEFAKEIFLELGIPANIIPISSKELNLPGKRPSTSILLNTKFTHLRHWKEALSDYLMAKTLIL